MTTINTNLTTNTRTIQTVITYGGYPFPNLPQLVTVTEQVVATTGVPDAGKMVKLDANGKLDPTLLAAGEAYVTNTAELEAELALGTKTIYLAGGNYTPATIKPYNDLQLIGPKPPIDDKFNADFEGASIRNGSLEPIEYTQVDAGYVAYSSLNSSTITEGIGYADFSVGTSGLTDFTVGQVIVVDSIAYKITRTTTESAGTIRAYINGGWHRTTSVTALDVYTTPLHNFCLTDINIWDDDNEVSKIYAGVDCKIIRGTSDSSNWSYMRFYYSTLCNIEGGRFDRIDAYYSSYFQAHDIHPGERGYNSLNFLTCAYCLVSGCPGMNAQATSSYHCNIVNCVTVNSFSVANSTNCTLDTCTSLISTTSFICSNSVNTLVIGCKAPNAAIPISTAGATNLKQVANDWQSKVSHIDEAETLTNKSITVADNTITTAAAGNLAATELNAALSELDGQDTTIQGNLDTHESTTSGIHGVTSNIVGVDDIQTLTQKVVVVANNTITTAASGNLVATELNAALAELDGQDTTIAGNLSNHIANDGSDHSFIDQSVVSGSSPTLDGTNITGLPDGGLSSGTTTTSAGVGDAAKLAKLDAAGKLDNSLLEYDLASIDTRVNALDAAVILMGTFAPTGGVFPGGGTAQAGESWIATDGATIDGMVLVADDRVIAIQDNAGTGTAAHWHKADYTDVVQSVAGYTGVVTLSRSDIGGVTTVLEGGTGQTTVQAAIDALTVATAGTDRMAWLTDGTNGYWGYAGFRQPVEATANYTTTVAFDVILCDTAAVGAFSVSLPATPNPGDIVRIVDLNSNFATANLTVDRNTKNIRGAASNLVLDADDIVVDFYYADATQGWVYSFGSGTSWRTPTNQTSAYTAFNHDIVHADTTGGAFTLTLPASPKIGTVVRVIDIESNWASDNLTIDRNGELIRGVAENLICDVDDVVLDLEYTDAGYGWAFLFTGAANPTPGTSDYAGILELATVAETNAGTDTTKAVTPAGVEAKIANDVVSATDAIEGIVELANNGEVIAGTDTARVVTPAGLAAKVASVTEKGIIEQATDAEAIARTDSTRAVSPANLLAMQQDAGSGFGRKNILINGNPSISQRGDYTSATTCSSTFYYLDRWKTTMAGSGTVQQVTASQPSGATFANSTSLKYANVGGGSGVIGCLQLVEDFERLSGQTVTFSAWVKSDTSDARIYIDADSTITTTAHTGGGSWEFLSITATLGTLTSHLAIYVRIASPTGTNITFTAGDYIEFTEAQLELGSQATSFEYRNPGEELALCQRYYESGTVGAVGVMATTTSLNCVITFKVPKRVAPTTITNGGATELYIAGTTPTLSSPTAASATTFGMSCNHTVGTAQTAGHSGILTAQQFTADAEL